MTDVLNEGGLTVKTLSEIITELEDGFRDIYGSDINVDQNSPDGQLINIMAQTMIDIRELAVAINNGFDPDQAVGVVLDQRVAINNIQRQGGTFTIQPIDITVDRTVDLDGLDDDFNLIDGEGYTVQDADGNEFILVDSTTITAGSHSLNFRAREIGQVETTIGTITEPVTYVLGVTTINNSTGAIVTGKQE